MAFIYLFRTEKSATNRWPGHVRSSFRAFCCKLYTAYMCAHASRGETVETEATIRSREENSSPSGSKPLQASRPAQDKLLNICHTRTNAIRLSPRGTLLFFTLRDQPHCRISEQRQPISRYPEVLIKSPNWLGKGRGRR